MTNLLILLSVLAFRANFKTVLGLYLSKFVSQMIIRLLYGITNIIIYLYVNCQGIGISFFGGGGGIRNFVVESV